MILHLFLSSSLGLSVRSVWGTLSHLLPIRSQIASTLCNCFLQTSSTLDSPLEKKKKKSVAYQYIALQDPFLVSTNGVGKGESE